MYELLMEKHAEMADYYELGLTEELDSFGTVCMLRAKQ